jgi:hypothetical protein
MCCKQVGTEKPAENGNTSIAQDVIAEDAEAEAEGEAAEPAATEAEA